MLIATDENFHHDIIRGLRRRIESLDILRVQDVIKEAEDPDLLEWAARENRVVLSHNATTLKRYADERVEQESCLFLSPYDADDHRKPVCC